MDAVAESDMRLWNLGDVETVRVREMPFIAIGRRQRQHDVLTRSDRLTADNGVLRRGPHQPGLNDGQIAQQFLDGAVHGSRAVPHHG